MKNRKILSSNKQKQCVRIVIEAHSCQSKILFIFVCTMLSISLRIFSLDYINTFKEYISGYTAKNKFSNTPRKSAYLRIKCTRPNTPTFSASFFFNYTDFSWRIRRVFRHLSRVFLHFYQNSLLTNLNFWHFCQVFLYFHQVFLLTSLVFRHTGFSKTTIFSAYSRFFLQ